MQLRIGFSNHCGNFLVPNVVTKFTFVAGIHHTKTLLTRAREAIREHRITEYEHTEPEKQEKRELRISCKRTEFNQYAGENYGKFDSIPLVSRSWHHRKSRGDHFIIHGSKENPALQKSSEPIKSFTDVGVTEDLVALLKKQNIITPTVIQAEGIPSILKGYNTVLTAETGCGKTLAYLLPLLQQIAVWKMLLKDRPFNSPLGVVISPNRELANQIGDVAMEFSRELHLRTEVLTGGHTKKKMLYPEFDDLDLLIASFGALSKLTTTGIYNKQHVHHVILDEADTLFDDSFNEKLIHFLKRFPIQFKGREKLSAIPRGVQLTLVSATLPTSLPDILGDVVEIDSMMRVSTSHVHKLMPHVPQKFCRMGVSDKAAKLIVIAKKNVAKNQPTIIFSNKSKTCDWISMLLNENGVPCVNLNGKMLLDVRAGKLNSFQTGEVNVISCTDIGSRGINTTRVKQVINFDFPLYMADYIHRCGRTGRVGSARGCKVINFISTDREVDVVQKIETAARKMEKLPNVNGNITRTIQNRIMRNMEREEQK